MTAEERIAAAIEQAREEIENAEKDAARMRQIAAEKGDDEAETIADCCDDLANAVRRILEILAP
jgi:vacuolar-type H+-ATPase subunit H